jgi:uroporphyrinogen decarboxylase
VDLRQMVLEIRKEQSIPDSVAGKHGGEAALSVNCYGVVLAHHKNFPQAHRVHGPFFQTADLDSFDWPLPGDVEGPELIASRVKELNDAGLCTYIRTDNPFKIAYFMRSFEDFMVDCVLEPDYALALVRRVAEVEFRRAENGVKAGARCAMIFGDFADQRSLMVSPDTFRRVLKPVLADYVERLRRLNPDVLVFLHSDGNLMSILPDLIECGFNAVHPIQPECMDMNEVKRLYGNRLTLFGGVSVQTELPASDPAGIRALVRRRIEALGADGGFILAPSNTILPDAPLESIFAMYREACAL